MHASNGAFIERKAEANDGRAFAAREEAMAEWATALKDLRSAVDRLGNQLSTMASAAAQICSPRTNINQSLPRLERDTERIEQQRSDQLAVKLSGPGSLGGDDEAPQPKESTLAQASLSVISSVFQTLGKSMLDSCGKNPCSCGKNRQWLLYSLHCPAPSPRFIPSRFNCSAGLRSYYSSSRDSFHLQSRALPTPSFLQLQALRAPNWGIEQSLISRQFHLQALTIG